MNIKINKNENISKPEIPKQTIGKNLTPKEKIYETILNVKSKQIKFECGAIMGKIKLDFDDKICLRWHYNNSSNFESFIESINEFLKTADCFLNDNDKIILEKEYTQFVNNK
ncbi:hypothetical protein M0Q97_12885 [Candidatus Dojkabacteria bacterium]|jgi:hypothetical protein|nr:hypothetical protein [Candidatus Dojkabacteria bacterium]